MTQAASTLDALPPIPTQTLATIGGSVVIEDGAVAIFDVPRPRPGADSYTPAEIRALAAQLHGFADEAEQSTRVD